VTISDFASAAILEKIEDSYDLEALRQASAEDSGKRFAVIHDATILIEIFAIGRRGMTRPPSVN